MPSRNRTFVRRLAVLLAVIQLAVLASVPVLEAFADHGAGRASVGAAHEGCAPVHQGATCLACALSAARARPPERPRLEFAEAEAHVADAPGPAAAYTRAPPPLPATRAPPLLAA